VVRRLGATVSLVALSIATPRAASANETTAEACVRASEEGQNARERSELRKAHESFAYCAAATCPKLLRADCTHWLEDVDRDTPSIVVGVKDARGDDVLDAKISVDGAPVRAVGGAALPVDPGPHVVRFERPGVPAVERKIVVRTGERNRLLVERLDAPASPSAPDPGAPATRDDRGGSRSVPTGAWVAGAIGVVGLAGFGVLGLMGASEKSRLRGSCAPSCTDSDVSKLKTFYIGADVSLVVGAIAIGVATWLVLSASDGSSATSLRARSLFTF
jgi:hypothetical protein